MSACKNCGHVFEGNYCNICGQSAETHRINLEFLWEDIEHGLLHYNKGIWFSLKKLFLKPGAAIQDYLDGKRVNHFRPISMVIVLATVYALIYHLGNINIFTKQQELTANMTEHIFEHYYWFIVITIPFYALTTYILFRKAGYNYFEIIILEAFKASQRMTVHIISLAFLYFFNDNSTTEIITILLLIIDLVLILWTNIEFFNAIPTPKVIFKSVLGHVIFLALITIILAVFQRFLGN